MDILTRAQALATGAKLYFTGQPCTNGHLCERRTASWACVECARAACREWRTANLDEQRARERAVKREWAVKGNNRHKRMEHCRLWYAANSTKAKADVKAWAAANRPAVRAIQANRRARKKAAEGRFTAEDIARIMKAQRGRCAGCRTSIEAAYHIDHITALVLGGSNWPRNLQLLCQPCNNKKHAKTALEWAQSLGRLL
jgi:5-methylcytosine-specific restriction endonuclease McrA